jgi:Rieske Fe-S protein
LISRFEKGGIFFFDAPTSDERKVILDLKIAKYKLSPEQVTSVPDLTDYTGREIDSMCDKCDMMGCTLTESARYVVPLLKSHAESMAELRQSAHHRFLSASHEGLYAYTPVKTEVVHTPTVTTTGRKMR